MLVDKLVMEKKEKGRFLLRDYINLAIDERNADAQKLFEANNAEHRQNKNNDAPTTYTYNTDNNDAKAKKNKKKKN